jgi:MFS family permease
VLGPFFDSKGRRAMIALTYAASGIGLAASGYAFAQGWLDATAQAMCWAAIFFIASAAASSAYLTVSETFPVEMRAVAIAIFYAAGTGAGGVIGPALFGMLIETGSRGALFYGYLIAAALMCVAAVVAIVLGVAAERRPLEHVAPPLSTETPNDDGKA